MNNNVRVKMFHTDAGHGWLAVKATELEEFGVADKISSYSYKSGDTVYLEEDCDAPYFIGAATSHGVIINFKYGKQRDRSPIRSKERYTPPTAKEVIC